MRKKLFRCNLLAILKNIVRAYAPAGQFYIGSAEIYPALPIVRKISCLWTAKKFVLLAIRQLLSSTSITPACAKGFALMTGIRKGMTASKLTTGNLPYKKKHPRGAFFTNVSLKIFLGVSTA